jgi:hypothetical protein
MGGFSSSGLGELLARKRMPEGPCCRSGAARAALLVCAATELDRLARRPWVGVALRAARLPARMAGFAALQGFLERGLLAFQRTPDAGRLLGAIQERETGWLEELFGAGEVPAASAAEPA